MKKVIIIGAGVIGVTTAYYLNKRGFDVEVIDKKETSATECSFANGGQLSYSHIEPWASPNIFRNLPQWLLKPNSPLKIHSHFDYKMWLWLVDFLKNCTKNKCQQTAEYIGKLALQSKQLMQEIITDKEIDFNFANSGTLHLFSTQKGLNQNIEFSKTQSNLGFKFDILNSFEDCLNIEPNLINAKRKIIGGIYYKDDECGDINLFTTKLTKILQDKGVKFTFNVNVNNLAKSNSQITHLQTNVGKIKGDAYVVATGAASGLLLDKLQIKNKIHPLKGYSITYQVKEKNILPKINITDQANKIVYSRLGDRLRVAGMVDFANFSDEIISHRIETLNAKISEFFPDILNTTQIHKWSCLRPSTSYCKPIIAKSKYSNLYLNTGHGSLGWTLSLASAKRLSELIK